MIKNSILYQITRPIISLFVKIVYHPKIIGANNIPEKGSVVLAGNHTNNLDCILVIASTKRTVHFLAKDELIKGIKKIIFLPMGIIPVNRKTHDKKALTKAIEVLNNNQVIGIFPEGTINRTNKTILPFKYGTVKMSKESRALVVPFVISGQYKPLKNELTIEFYKPYYIKDDLEVENKKLMNIISNEIRKKRD